MANLMCRDRLKILYGVTAVRAGRYAAIGGKTHATWLRIEENIGTEDLRAAARRDRYRQNSIISAKPWVRRTEADQIDAVLCSGEGAQRWAAKRIGEIWSCRPSGERILNHCREGSSALKFRTCCNNGADLHRHGSGSPRLGRKHTTRGIALGQVRMGGYGMNQGEGSQRNRHTYHGKFCASHLHFCTAF